MLDKNRNQEQELEILKFLKENPYYTQRQLAKKLGLSLGKTHYLLRGLTEKGWIKLENFKQSNNKKGYMYLLTWTGLSEKSRMTWEFLRRKEQEYEELKKEIETLKLDIKKED